MALDDTTIKLIYSTLSQVTDGYQLSETPRLHTIVFGDGYKQTTPDGLIAVDRKLTLRWTNIPSFTASALCEFFREHSGQMISFIAPREISPRLWSVTDWQRSSPEADGDVVNATFEERPFVYGNVEVVSVWDRFGTTWDLGSTVWDRSSLNG